MGSEVGVSAGLWFSPVLTSGGISSGFIALPALDCFIKSFKVFIPRLKRLAREDSP